jgi:hypothetical protein
MSWRPDHDPLVRLFGVLCLAAMLFALGASTPHASSTAGPVYTTADLPVIASPKPTSPKGVLWSVTDPYVGNGRGFTLKEWQELTDKAQAGRLSRAGFRLGANRVWRPAGNTYNTLSAASVFVFLFQNARGSQAWFDEQRSRFPRQAKTLDAHGLGTESFGGEVPVAAFYEWRTGNLVVEAQVQCQPKCDFNVVAPARAYANKINAQAVRASR